VACGSPGDLAASVRRIRRGHLGTVKTSGDLAAAVCEACRGGEAGRSETTGSPGDLASAVCRAGGLRVLSFNRNLTSGDPIKVKVVVASVDVGKCG